MRNPRALILILAVLLAVSSIASARPYNSSPNSLKFRYGEFELDGDSIYWQTRREDFFGSESAFDDDRLGVDFTRMVSERLGVMVSVSQHDGQQTTAFRDFVDDLGADIEHTTDLETADLSAGMVFYLLRRDAIVAPYIGAGLGIYFYDLTESGDFIDFDTFAICSGSCIFEGTFTGQGEALGLFFLVGIEVPVTASFSIFGEARWHDARADLEGDFHDFGEIDLGGKELSFGISFRF